jgi:hypothetical protein
VQFLGSRAKPHAVGRFAEAIADPNPRNVDEGKAGRSDDETVGSLDKDQLTRLARYFDEKVMSDRNYKIA